MRIAAHRGVHYALPENSVAAFEAAIDIGADYIEFDVRLTRDGVAVVTHDLELQRSLGVPGNVFEKDLAELQRLPLVGSPEGTPLFIPSLDEVLERFAGRIGLEIELKDPRPELPVAVAAALEPHRVEWDSIEVTAFDPALLVHFARAITGPIGTCLLVGSTKAYMTAPMHAYTLVGQARLADVAAVHLHPSQLGPMVIDAVRTAGLALHVWDVNDAATFSKAVASGATHCDTDRPEEMLALRAAL